MRSEPFTRRAPGASSVVAPGALVDKDLLWARSLLIGVDDHPPAPDAAIPTNNGNMVFQLSGVFRLGHYTRRFALQRFQTVELDISGFMGVKLFLLRSNLLGVNCFAFASERVVPIAPRPVASLPLRVDAGVQAVPWGARRLRAASADPGFVWRGWDDGATAVNVSDPLAIGDERDVLAPLYVPSVAFQALWEIEL